MILTPYFKSTLLFLIYLLVVFLAEVFFVYLLQFDFFFNLDDDCFYFIDTVVYVVLFTMLLVFHKFLPPKDIKYDGKISFKNILLVVFLIILLRIIRDPIINFNYIFFHQKFPTNFYAYTQIEFLTNFLNVVLLGSIFEEILFRKTMIDFFWKKNKIIQGIIFSSLLYSLIHMHFYSFDFSSNTLLYTFLLGLLLGWIYVKTKNILYPIIAHFTANFIWLLLGVYAAQYWKIVEFFNFGFVYWLIIFGTIIWFFFTTRKISSP